MLTFSRSKLANGLSRRAFLQVGALGAGLTLADLLRLRAQGTAQAAGRPKGVILIYQRGGPSHIDTYDPKPDAPAEIRGEFKAAQTIVPGFAISELLPLQAKLTDKLTVVRNLRMGGVNHNPWECLTGYYPQPGDNQPGRLHPAAGSVVSRLRGAQDMPPYVSLRDGKDEDPAYLGAANRPFLPTGPGLENLALSKELTPERMTERRALLGAFDTLRRDLDTKRELESLDTFTAQALELVSSTKTRDAFDVKKEPAHVRERYGHHVRLLQALRLVEAGVGLVTVDAPQFGAGDWDNHTQIFPVLRNSLPHLEQGFSALIADLYERGLNNDVVVLMWGEFGRSPRINKEAGRDHWSEANAAIFAGGGLKMGQVVGATDAHGARPKGAAYSARNVMATLYHVLGIDPATTLPDQLGRPMQLLDDPRPIAELV